MDLLDAVIDRAADILERIGAEVDQVSHDIFEPDAGARPEPPGHSQVIGRKGDLTSKVRESLVSIGRLLLLLANEADSMRWPKETRAQLQGDAARRAVAVRPRDLSFQQDHLPARRHARRRHIEQNNIIKIFSVAAVVLMPPTLVASIYGMNFKHMPELDWTLGYPLAIAMMLIAAALPYFIFKWKKWL